MASGALVITAVSGAGPWTVTVQDAGSLANSDHLGGPTSSADGVWVVSSLSGNSFTATDSLDPDGGSYGAPATGAGWFATPAADSTSPIPKGAVNWNAAALRNARVAAASTVITSTADGRLSLSSSDPLGEASGAATLYYLPFTGETVALYSGSTWAYHSIPSAGVSVALSGGTASKPHDVFLYDNSGTLTLELVAWTDDTNRATALAQQDTVYVKSGATTRRYVGSVYLDGSKQCTFDATGRGLWNENNRVAWASYRQEATNSWTYDTASWRQANGSASNQISVMLGRKVEALVAEVYGLYSHSSGNNGATGIGIDSSTTNSAQTFGSATGGGTGLSNAGSRYAGSPSEGFRDIRWLEFGAGSSTTTFWGDVGSTYQQSGLVVTSYH